VEGERRPVVKLSPGKVTYPEAKQVYRRSDESGTFERDLLALQDEPAPEEPGACWEPLLAPVLRGGAPVGEPDDLEASRARARDQIGRLPGPTRRLRDPQPLPLGVSPALQRLCDSLGASHFPG